MIYFAGTGIEVDGVNYMIPIDADEKRALFFVTDHPQMSLETAFDAVKGAKTLRLVITDSCRVDPVVELGGKGLAQVQKLKVVEPPRGVVVAYSTAAGQYAFDGDGQISPYAQALIDGLRQPGVELPTVFRRVSARVEASSSGSQIPVVLGNWPAEDLFVAPKQ